MISYFLYHISYIATLLRHSVTWTIGGSAVELRAVVGGWWAAPRKSGRNVCLIPNTALDVIGKGGQLW